MRALFLSENILPGCGGAKPPLLPSPHDAVALR